MISMGMHTIYNVTTGILYFSPVDTSHLNILKCFKVYHKYGSVVDGK